ncbi:murein transglycosylase A [Thauera linaloolentis]|nr:murein transglycosylase A [Thauera linaloolentis]MCM8565776.1 murein transglycosylase A [Thauera linaloolentis]
MIPAPTRPARLALPFLLALLGACATPSKAPDTEAQCPPQSPCPACPSCPPPAAERPPAPATARPADPAAEPPPAVQASWSSVAGWSEDDPAAAWPALLASCSKLARQPNWKPVCDAASALGSAPGSQQARRYFEQHFVPWQLLGSGPSAEGLVTGYYEPLIRGSRSRSGQYAWPIHGVPADMLTIELGDVYPELKSLRLRGRIVGNKILPYWTREQVQERGAQLPAPVLLWADDPIDLFFLQVQGSGRVQLPDGKTVRIGYADQNGHPYQSIGRWLVAKGELSLDQASMDGIKRWARDNPDRLREMLNANPSYVFFRELPVSDAGPVGALSVPLSEGRSIAIDPRYVPLGAPVFLATTHPLSTRPLSRLVLAQDTGSAIKGAVRADFFWGFGEKAGREAGRMRQQGRMWLLLPKGMQPPRR